MEKFLISGLVGAILFFLGDMFLYFDKEGDPSLDPQALTIKTMSNVSIKRLYIGGILGPIGAFFAAIGFYHIVLIVKDLDVLAWAIFLIMMAFMFIGGSYHCQFVYIGLAARAGDDKALEEINKFLNFQTKFPFTIMALLAQLALTILVATGRTILANWMAILTPMVVVLLMIPFSKLPDPYRIVLAGGWSNLTFAVYYLALLLIL